jgi:hypothetical protein
MIAKVIDSFGILRAYEAMRAEVCEGGEISKNGKLEV